MQKDFLKSLKMRKRILSGLFALALLATAGFGVQKSMKSEAGLSDLALANVEALAQNEDGNDSKGYASVLTTLMSTHIRCVNTIAITTKTFNVNCLGEGDMECTEGTTIIEYESGRCA